MYISIHKFDASSYYLQTIKLPSDITGNISGLSIFIIHTWTRPLIQPLGKRSAYSGQPVHQVRAMYEGRSINKLQNGAIPLILKIGKIRNIRFVEKLILNIQKKKFADDVIIVTSSCHRTVYLCIIYSTSFLS